VSPPPQGSIRGGRGYPPPGEYEYAAGCPGYFQLENSDGREEPVYPQELRFYLEFSFIDNLKQSAWCIKKLARFLDSGAEAE